MKQKDDEIEHLCSRFNFFTTDFIKIEEWYGGEVNIGMDAKKFLGNHQIFDDFFVTP